MNDAPQITDITTLSDLELRALRGDHYTDRDNATAAIERANANINVINQEMARREHQAAQKAAKTEGKDAKIATTDQPK
jgi:hypothetical protein